MGLFGKKKKDDWGIPESFKRDLKQQMIGHLGEKDKYEKALADWFSRHKISKAKQRDFRLTLTHYGQLACLHAPGECDAMISKLKGRIR